MVTCFSLQGTIMNDTVHLLGGVSLVTHLGSFPFSNF